MKLVAGALVSAAILIHCQAFAFGPDGHMAVGAIADELLKGTHTAKETRRILGSNLRTAAVWTDCAKGVNEKTFKYGGVGRFAECAIYEKSSASKRLMEDFVKRNVGTCPMLEGAETCHRQYHYADVATQRDTYQLGTQGTSDHDIVHAINAMIAVLKGEPAPAPFHINSKKEALRLLAHYVGDIHQPLHVGAVYLDTSGQVIDPDDGGFDPKTETTGGNDLLLDRPGTVSRPRSLHHEWDAVKGIVVNMPVPDNFIRQARAVPVSSDPIDTWSVAWATESVLASQEAFKDLIYEPLDDNAKRYLVTLPDGYGTARGKVQRARVVQAGARLAQILNEIWP